MVDEVYFFDSYAIIELIRDNPRYRPYLMARMATTLLNIIEVHYILLRDFGKKIADAYFQALLPTAIDYVHAIPPANELRLQLRKRNVSAADCVGYTLAFQSGIKFLTGDQEFEELENVEYVK